MPNVTDAVEDLRNLLMAKGKPVVLEELACELLGRLVGVVFSRARGGSQEGGDGGVRGHGGRQLIYEAKRYGTHTSFDNRSIRGEIDEAVQRNPDLDAWILVATRDVPEQALTAMEAAARPRGVEALTIDWLPRRLPRLAALCASAPGDVEAAIGHECRELLMEIRSSEHYDEVLESLKASLRDATVGFELLRKVSHQRVRDIWSSRRSAEACFGQNVAGGEAGAPYIERAEPNAGLDAWDLGAVGRADEPALVVGREGVGKTWAVVDWLRSRLNRLPIVVLAPSKALGGPITGRTDLEAFIARCLRDIDRTSERGKEYWEARVTRLLRRPLEEGAVLTLFFDGLNEEPSYDWIRLLNQLQEEPFHGRIRVIASARDSFVEDRLANLERWAWSPTRVEVGPYDDTPAGEFDQRLNRAGLTRDDLPTKDLLDLARVPRLFDLVVGMKDRLGGVGSVTVHRLFWEYGAMAIPTDTMGASEWRAFVLRLAEEFLQHHKRLPQAQVDMLGSVAAIVDGAFAQTGDWGDVEFEDDFVRHALGLALVRKLDGKTASESKEELEQFFGPLNDHDEEPEIVRAAISIALAKGADESRSFLGALCGHWVRCQNLPKDHLLELATLAAELVEPLLDVVEATAGHAASSPRYRAVNALDNVNHQDASVARAIADRGARWLARISRGQGDAPHDEERIPRRGKRLESRIGSGGLGRVTVLERELEIVAHADEGLDMVAAQLLQGRPLAVAVELFEVAALQMAIIGDASEELRYLNMVNVVDPTETAQLLRSRSEAMLQREPENGVHDRLNERVAALLLWRTGYQEDVERALDVDPGLDRFPSYAEDYEKDPAKSAFGLERRHVEATLLRRDVPLRLRVQRAAEYLVDPSLVVPREFVEEAIRTAHSLDWSNLAIWRSRAAEDWMWRDLSRVLARLAPEELALIERKRLRGFGEREGEARTGAAMAAPDLMLLVDESERSALRALRERTPSEPDDTEPWTQTQLLIAEVQGERALDQFRRIVAAELDFVDASLARACASLSKAELDELLQEQEGNPAGLLKIAELVGEGTVDLSRPAFDTFVGMLFGGSRDLELDPVWLVLGLNAPARLGALLDERGWAWSADKPYLENLMGSLSVAAANRRTPLGCFGSRLAPMTLLPTVFDRGAVTEEAEFAVELIGKILMQPPVPAPKTTLDVSHDHSTAEGTVNYLHTYGDIRERPELGAIGQFHSRTREDYEERRQALAKRYSDEVMEARRQGASFHLEFVRPEHLAVVLAADPEAVDQWLEGMTERSYEFTARVQVADGLFVALCEVLLARSPDLGLELWRALKDVLQLKFTIHGDMDRLQEALFAAASSLDVEEALEEAYGLDGARTDRELIALVVAARRHGRVAWLSRMVAQDENSQCPLHRRRAAFLKPLLTVPEVAQEADWPRGEFADGVHGASWKLAQREAFAQHWLCTFSDAESVVQAHAAWQLFLACVDRRVWSWLDDVLNYCEGEPTGLVAAKTRFVEQQKQAIHRAIRENEKHWDKNYTHMRYPRGLKPWSH